MEPAAGGDSSRFSVCVGSVQSRGFGLEGSEVGTCGSSSALPAGTQGQNICPGGSLAEPALAKHPFGCAGANSRARILLQLLQSTGQLKESTEKHQNKYPEELLGNFHIFFVFCFCLQTYRDSDCWSYCLFIKWVPQDTPQFSRFIRGKSPHVHMEFSIFIILNAVTDFSGNKPKHLVGLGFFGLIVLVVFLVWFSVSF